MTSDEYVCPVCGQPVDTVVHRHKTMGVVVPLWGPGPCKNPECEAYTAEEPSEPAPVVTADSRPPGAAETDTDAAAEQDS
ncbi:hypothetical protein [Streptomyces sporangiiformans]|uniref:Uncharacterized protein n=1 Tax=Streptomyces sporangiiformans TaxID=2315329 RepID=A0A505DDX1_9ACTN|nr:hypothetical protein [Streptomyces sporangiiformans]TPQ15959.1 hypothetical protein FGD71_044290 [Streptomyces sporangiiformans]